MGNKVAIFTEEQLEDYQDCTYFTRKEILKIQKRFRELDPSRIPLVMTSDQPHTAEVNLDKIEKMPELKENPFRQRICKVFSHDGSGNMVFDDFLDMFSVFSEQAPRDLKIYYAFKIFDYDGDGIIGPKDIQEATIALTKAQLNNEDIQVVVDKVLEEGDIDGDGYLSIAEFQHLVSRAPDFVTSFHVRI